MNQPEFPTVFRGYDPVQVDQHVTALEQIAEAARQEAAQSAVELSKLRHVHEALSEELEDQRRAITELEAQTRTVSSPTFADLGERIGAMLGLADEEAAAMREGANGGRRGDPPRRTGGRRPGSGRGGPVRRGDALQGGGRGVRDGVARQEGGGRHHRRRRSRGGRPPRGGRGVLREAAGHRGRLRGGLRAHPRRTSRAVRGGVHRADGQAGPGARRRPGARRPPGP